MTRIVHVALVALFASLTHFSALFAQTHNEEAATPEDVLPLAGRTLDAIRHRDVDSLAKLADPEGVFIGVDVPRISATQFKKELFEKRGSFCVIFDAACLPNKGANSKSLREILVQQPITMSASKIGGLSQECAVVIRKEGGPGETLFTLIFRKVKGVWRMQQIEYW